jgi:predicted enzyme related to lactoylglutathione lyase
MPTRDHAPAGAPCWTDLWTSDVDGSRAFYRELFGWEAEEPSPEFGGYFMFTRDGVPVAGGMGDMGGMPANNTWKIYLSTPDLDATAAAVTAGGGEVVAPAMPVADLGRQLVFIDPTGANLGAWEPGTFPGFTVLDEPGSPSWFELYTRDYHGALAFYDQLVPLATTVMSVTDEFRYATLDLPDGSGHQVAGIMDAAGFLPEGVPSHWITYWEVADVDASYDTVASLGGTQLEEPTDTPYGRMAKVTDPAGAQFKLCRAPR